MTSHTPTQKFLRLSFTTYSNLKKKRKKKKAELSRAGTWVKTTADTDTEPLRLCFTIQRTPTFKEKKYRAPGVEITADTDTKPLRLCFTTQRTPTRKGKKKRSRSSKGRNKGRDHQDGCRRIEGERGCEWDVATKNRIIHFSKAIKLQTPSPRS